MNDFLTQYTHFMHERMNEEMENAIVDFLEGLGIEVGEDRVASVTAIQEELSKSNRTLRCEYFMKFNDDGCSFTGLCIPFIDFIDYPMTRAELYELHRLQEKGYSYKGEKVWL